MFLLPTMTIVPWVRRGAGTAFRRADDPRPLLRVERGPECPDAWDAGLRDAVSLHLSVSLYVPVRPCTSLYFCTLLQPHSVSSALYFSVPRHLPVSPGTWLWADTSLYPSTSPFPLGSRYPSTSPFPFGSRYPYRSRYPCTSLRPRVMRCGPLPPIPLHAPLPRTFLDPFTSLYVSVPLHVPVLPHASSLSVPPVPPRLPVPPVTLYPPVPLHFLFTSFCCSPPLHPWVSVMGLGAEIRGGNAERKRCTSEGSVHTIRFHVKHRTDHVLDGGMVGGSS